ncbi:hypothetical protein GOP47_0022791 [Adiantum capillus-veneris]|uniref:ATPase AAA-type core domain-containing protein n=1 Tax=Adiantum capillus-veneris TaxID=13818 RepID=A0A9D4U6H2_ADICA|nr:hypothetical protein GOP47_0022791 [Adiantum capillus-veneris]
MQHHLARLQAVNVWRASSESMDGVDENVKEDQTKTGNVKDPKWRWPTCEKCSKEEATEDGINCVSEEREGDNAAVNGNGNAEPDGRVVAHGVSDGEEEQTFSCLHLHHLLRFLETNISKMYLPNSSGLKRWGYFNVAGVREITFEDQAYEQLVMKSAKKKDKLKAIWTTYLLEESGRGRGVYVVAQKGEGCVVLCSGPPGTGKTLITEMLVETLHRPLWAVSAFELA